MKVFDGNFSNLETATSAALRISGNGASGSTQSSGSCAMIAMEDRHTKHGRIILAAIKASNKLFLYFAAQVYASAPMVRVYSSTALNCHVSVGEIPNSQILLSDPVIGSPGIAPYHRQFAVPIKLKKQNPIFDISTATLNTFLPHITILNHDRAAEKSVRGNLIKLFIRSSGFHPVNRFKADPPFRFRHECHIHGFRCKMFFRGQIRDVNRLTERLIQIHIIFRIIEEQRRTGLGKYRTVSGSRNFRKVDLRDKDHCLSVIIAWPLNIVRQVRQAAELAVGFFFHDKAECVL